MSYDREADFPYGETILADDQDILEFETLLDIPIEFESKTGKHIGYVLQGKAMLSKGQILELAQKAFDPKDGMPGKLIETYSGDIAARNKIVEHNIGLVFNIVSMYRSVFLFASKEDLISYGCLGLIRAAEKYNPNKLNPANGEPYAFSTYATPWVRQSIERNISMYSSIRQPTHVGKAMNKFRRVEKELAKLGVLRPTDDDIMQYIADNDIKYGEKDLTLEQLHFYRNQPVALNAVQFSLIGEDEDYDIIESSPTPVPDFSISERDRKILFDAIDSCLTSREANIIKLRLGLGLRREYTLDELRKMINLTRERVRQIEVEAKEKLKVYFRENGITLTDFI